MQAKTKVPKSFFIDNIVDELYQYVETDELNKLAKTVSKSPDIYCAFKVGCSFSISLYQKFSQPFFYCLTCNLELDDENLGICLMCAMICHAGHRL